MNTRTAREMKQIAVVYLMAAVALLLMDRPIWAASEAIGVTRAALIWTAVIVIMPVAVIGVKIWNRPDRGTTRLPW